MENYLELSMQELEARAAEVAAAYEKFKEQKLSLDMSRGKPSPEQLNLCNELLTAACPAKTAADVDGRNYGIGDGIPEAKKFFSDLLGIPADQIIAGGNSSLNLMYDTMARFMLFGTCGSTPWCRLDKVKFLCPSPGYDRHFSVCEDFGIEMITVPMTASGPDMDAVEKLVAADDSIKGMWCVPLYSNPEGIIYSDETVERLAKMQTAAADFRIMWDNAYGIHHIYSENSIKDILQACADAGNADRVMYFFSTSKITFPGAGVAIMAASPANIAEVKKHMAIQTIGPDKLNQLRTLAFLKDPETTKAHMKKLADSMRPKFDIVLNTLDAELAGSGLLKWHKPAGGYFVSVDTLPGCAKETVRLAKEAGVVLTGAGATFPYKKDPNDSNIRIAPTYPSCAELQTAMELFCICVKLAGLKKLLGRQA